MRGLFCRRLIIYSQRFNHQSSFLQTKPFCNNTTKNPSTTNNEIANDDKFDPYKEVHDLNFEKASRILFSEPRRRKKFGIDFHLVQLFFALMPSLAVYLVALYARSLIKIRKAELEKLRIADEEAEAKAKEMELKAAAEAVAANPYFVEVKERLDKLEGTIKDIVVEARKQSSNSEDESKLEKSKQEPAPTKPNSTLDNKHSSSTTTSKTSSNARKQSSNLEDESNLEKSKQEPEPTKPNSTPDKKHSSSAATSKTSSNAEGDA